MIRYFITLVFVWFSVMNAIMAVNHRDSVDVLHYDLHVEVLNPNYAFIKGNALLNTVVLYDAGSIAFDLYHFDVDSIVINDALVPFIKNDTKVRVLSSFNAQDSVIISFYYNGTPSKDPSWGGFFFQEGFAYNIGVGMGSYPHGIGRFWYPCIDNFTDRATYDYYIKTTPPNKGLGGGLLVDEWLEDDGMVYHWSLQDPIPTYLSSIAVGPFVLIDTTYQGDVVVPLQLFSSKSDSLGMLKTFSQIHETTRAFEKCFGPYQFDKIGFVSVPFNRGAMEHATNIAFPSNALTGSIKDKTLAAHELSHHWFGNLVTCASSQDMWLNEGWASYCEVIFKQEVVSEESAHYQVVSNHNNVLQTVHKSDGGHFPLNQLPPEITYGKHAYDKGSDVVNTLRHYLGDSLFFKGVNHYLNKYAFNHATSQNLCDALTESTGVNMQAFFNNWVYQPGFPHYSVDSFASQPLNENEFLVNVAMRHKLNARKDFSLKNRVELTFMDEEWNAITKQIEFNGEYETVEVSLPFSPKALFIDLDKKTGDATIDEYQVINKLGLAYFNNCDFKLNVSALTDSVFVQVVHNYALADADVGSLSVEGVRVSNYHYWTIHGILPEGFQAEGNLFYNFSNNTNPDNGVSPSPTDTVVLLYRKNATQAWKVEAIGGSAKLSFGELNIASVKAGEYAIGFWDGTALSGYQKPIDFKQNKCYPIPTNNRCNIQFGQIFTGNIIVYNNVGCKIQEQHYQTINDVSINTEDWLAGLYFIKVEGTDNDTFRVIKN